MKNIEELNRQIINCRILNSALKQEPNNSLFRINQNLLVDVIEHRKQNGSPSMMDITKQLHKTKKNCKTINPLNVQWGIK